MESIISHPSSLKPIPYEPSFEKMENNETDITSKIISHIKKISETTHRDTGHATRASHAKSQGLLFGKLKVNPDLPDILAQGIFAKQSTYDVIIRISTAPGDILDDDISTSRGLAIKIKNVEGERLPGSEDETAQDFIMIDHPVFFVKNSSRVLQNFRMLSPTTDKVAGLKKIVSASAQLIENILENFGIKSIKLQQMGGHKKTHILGESFFTQVPILYGPYMAKLSIVPVSENLTRLKDMKLNLKNKPDGLRDAVKIFFKNEEAIWDVRVQLCTDINKMPLEEANVEWPQDISPYISVAQISAPPQEAWSKDLSKQIDDEMSFRPWHGIADHRPLGSVMRARKAAYEFSSGFRAQLNNCPMREPSASK